MSEVEQTSGRPIETRPSRRTFLRGVGVTMALPGWSRPRLGLLAGRQWSAGPLSEAVRRNVHGCGVNTENWWPRARATRWNWRVPPAAQGPSRQDQRHQRPVQQAGHRGRHPPGQTGNILSGAALQKGAELKGGISVDSCSPATLARRPLSPAWSWAASSRSPATRDQLLDGV